MKAGLNCFNIQVFQLTLIINNFPAKSRGILQTIFCKIEQDNCFIIQQIVNKTLFNIYVTENTLKSTGKEMTVF